MRSSVWYLRRPGRWRTGLALALLGSLAGPGSGAVQAANAPPAVEVRVEWKDFARLLQRRRPEDLARVERDVAGAVAALVGKQFGYLDWIAECPDELPAEERTADCGDPGHIAEWIVGVEGRSDEFTRPPTGTGTYRRVILTHTLRKPTGEVVLLTQEYKPVADPNNPNDILYDVDSPKAGEKSAGTLKQDLEDKLEEQLPGLLQEPRVLQQLREIPVTRKLGFEENAHIVVPVERCRFRPGEAAINRAMFTVSMKRGGDVYEFTVQDRQASGEGDIVTWVLKDAWKLSGLLDLPQGSPEFIGWVPGLPGLVDEPGEDVDVFLHLLKWNPVTVGCQRASGPVVGDLEMPEEPS